MDSEMGITGMDHGSLRRRARGELGDASDPSVASKHGGSDVEGQWNSEGEIV